MVTIIIIILIYICECTDIHSHIYINCIKSNSELYSHVSTLSTKSQLHPKVQTRHFTDLSSSQPTLPTVCQPTSCYKITQTYTCASTCANYTESSSKLYICARQCRLNRDLIERCIEEGEKERFKCATRTGSRCSHLESFVDSQARLLQPTDSVYNFRIVLRAR